MARRLVAFANVLVGLVLACALAWPLYENVRLVAVAGYAGVVGVGTAIVARMRRWPAWLHALAVAGAYLVGGTVRDILLGEPNFDVDVAVEGDAVAFAEALAQALDGRVRAHRKFGTAVVLYGDDGRGRVDVVTARTEFYDAPAALPTIEHATIREDLHRRDFTINAMAVSLKGEDFGRLVDPFGGRRDLERRTIRVLHNLSFIDDPTRIFRAVRYESRLGFAMNEHTQRLARGTVLITGTAPQIDTARSYSSRSMQSM